MVGPLFAQTAWTNVTAIGSEVRTREKIWCLRRGESFLSSFSMSGNLHVAVCFGSRAARRKIESLGNDEHGFSRPGAMCMAAAIMISPPVATTALFFPGSFYAMARSSVLRKKGHQCLHVRHALVAQESGPF